jgi:hypothetical protein
MTKRLAELVVVLSVVALFGFFFGPRHDNNPYGGVTPSPGTEPAHSLSPLAVNPNVRSVPAFELPGAFGGAYRFDDLAGSSSSSTSKYHEHHGPLFITLTAIGCGDCQARVPTDTQAYQLVHNHGLQVWNILVFATTPEQGQIFVDRFHPTADSELIDPGGSVSVGKLGGSDAACWILIDKNDHIAWQGGGDLARLEEQLKRL